MEEEIIKPSFGVIAEVYFAKRDLEILTEDNTWVDIPKEMLTVKLPAYYLNYYIRVKPEPDRCPHCNSVSPPKQSESTHANLP